MRDFVIFLHALGAVAIGFYLLFPFVAGSIKGLSPQSQTGFARVLRSLNRIGQWLLLVQFITGGYLTHGARSIPWLIVIVVLMVLLFGVTGMLGGPLKRLAGIGGEGGEGGAASAADISKLTMFGAISAVLVLALLVLMYYPIF